MLFRSEKEKEEDWDEETTPLDGIIKSIAKQSTIEKLLSELNSNYEQIKRILQKMHAGDRQNDAVEVLNAIKYALERINVSAHSDSARLSKIKDYAQKIENLGIYGKETTGWFAGWGDNDLKKVNREIIKIIDAMSAKNSAWLYLDILTTNNEETFLKSFNVTQLNNSSKKKIATQKLFLIMHGVAGSILKNSAMANMWNEIHREELILKQAITHLEKITTDTATATTLRTLINHIDKAIKSYDTHAVGKDQQTQQGLFQNAITEIRHACDQIIKITKSHLSQHG